MNNNIETQENHGIRRKIVENYKYRIWRKDFNNMTFYSIQLKQTLLNGNEFKYYQPVRFRKGVDLPNGTDIVIKKAIENDRPNPKDDYGFIREYMILEYEEAGNALKEYQEQKEESNGEDEIQVSESDLPF